jgi:hypothetical protein
MRVKSGSARGLPHASPLNYRKNGGLVQVRRQTFSQMSSGKNWRFDSLLRARYLI